MIFKQNIKFFGLLGVDLKEIILKKTKILQFFLNYLYIFIHRAHKINFIRIASLFVYDFIYVNTFIFQVQVAFI